MQGLANLGNTCYINTLVQCLGHVRCFRRWMLSERGASGAFTQELQQLLAMMWNGQQSVAPRRFVECMVKVFDLGSIGEQHDLWEVFLRVIDRISWEDRSEMVSIDERAAGRGRSGSSSSTAMDILYKMAVKAWTGYHPRGFRTFDAMMEGLQVHQVQCMECKKCFHNFEPFMVLNIDMDMDARAVDHCVRSYFGTEQLHEWSCDHCKRVQPAEKTVRIWQFPDVLTVALKRFEVVEGGRGARKIRTAVDIPQHLRFDEESSIRGVSNGETVYELRSIGLHHGFMNHGHYTCVANHKNKWIHYDDMQVSEVDDIDKFCSQNAHAYLLIYERRGTV